MLIHLGAHVTRDFTNESPASCLHFCSACNLELSSIYGSFGHKLPTAFTKNIHIDVTEISECGWQVTVNANVTGYQIDGECRACIY